MRCYVLLCVFAVVSAVPVPDLQDFLQLEAGKVSFRVQDLYNITCDECWRMQEAMSDFCQANGHTLQDSNGFREQCKTYITPVTRSQTLTEMMGKCATFEKFTQELFCPQDPCTQITQSIHTAPNALCQMLECTSNSSKPLPSHADEALLVPAQPVPPLSCGRYYSDIMDACKSEKERREDFPSAMTSRLPPKHTGICERIYHAQSFEREGCELVFAAAKESAVTDDACDALLCDNDTASKFCKNVGLPLDSAVPLPEHYLYLIRRNASDETLIPSMGVLPVTATIGPTCKDTKDNLLYWFNKTCLNRQKCVLPHPQTAELPKELPEGCEAKFEIVYRCTTDGPRHSLFGPAGGDYESITLDCSPELPKYPPLDPAKRPHLFSEVTEENFESLYHTPLDTRKH